MPADPFETCPRCGTAMEPGFASGNVGLSFVARQKFDSFAFLDEDLTGSGLRKLLPSRAEYLRSAVCRSCRLYLVDYGEAFDRAGAEEIARGPAAGG